MKFKNPFELSIKSVEEIFLTRSSQEGINQAQINNFLTQNLDTFASASQGNLEKATIEYNHRKLYHLITVLTLTLTMSLTHKEKFKEAIPFVFLGVLPPSAMFLYLGKKKIENECLLNSNILTTIYINRINLELESNKYNNCLSCQYYSPNGYLKCAVHPFRVNTKEVLDCVDYSLSQQSQLES